jgi:ribonucleoside-diphosphate reductase alpha chain
MWNENWIKGEDYPVWGDTDVYKKTISGGYLYNGETPKEAYQRVAKAVASRLYKPEMSETFFNYIWNGWLCLASPVLSNTGTDRGLPISCFGIDVADSIQDIGSKNLEMMLLAKHGGGVGIGINQIRPAGAKITGNGTSDGVVPFCKIYDSTILATNQGSVRRGAAQLISTLNMTILNSGLKLENQKEMLTDNRLTYINAQLLVISLCDALNKEMRTLEIDGVNFLENEKQLENRMLCLKEMLTKQIQKHIKKRLKSSHDKYMSEITLHTDESHSFVCCLSSLNLAKYEEWKDTNLIYDSIFFLDGVMEEFIQRAKGLRGFENSVRSAQKGRALGLGVLGWHTYLQEKGIPFEGLLSQFETRKIFSQIKIESERASRSSC